MALISSIPTFHEQEKDKQKNKTQTQTQPVQNPLKVPDTMEAAIPSAKEWYKEVTYPFTLKQNTTTNNASNTGGSKSSWQAGSFYPYPSHDELKNQIDAVKQETVTETDKESGETDVWDQLSQIMAGQGNGGVLPDLTATFKTNNEQAMKQSQTLSDNIYGKLSGLESLYKDLYNDQKNYNPLEADWAKELLSYYGIESGEAADNARASGAADNAGNVDSYAAANAERQRLSTLNAGVNSVSGMSQNRFNNMLSTLQSLGVDTTNLFGVEQQNVQAALENAGKTGNILTSVNETQTAADQASNQLILDLMTALNAGTAGTEKASGLDSSVVEELLPSIYEVYPDANEDDVVNMLVAQLVEDGYTTNKEWAKVLVNNALNQYKVKKSKYTQGPEQ